MNQNITGFNGVISHISLTNDHSYMAVTTYGDKVYLFRHTGTGFSFFQSFSYSSANGERAFLSDDHEYLVMPIDGYYFGNVSEAHIYNYSDYNKKYEPHMMYTFYKTHTHYISLTEDGYFMGFSGTDRTMTVSNPLDVNEYKVEHIF